MLIAVHGPVASANGAVAGTPAGDFEAAGSLEELTRLLATAGATPVATMVQRLQVPHPHTYFQRGKLDALRQCCRDRGAGLVVADDELSPGQQRALEEALRSDGWAPRVIDRTAVILDIFARHAHSRDGTLQVELAQLRYTLPRLASTQKALSRQGAGIGTRGPGESGLETDRRRVKRRITRLLGETEALRAQRAVHRRWRTRQGVETVAIVGYTNAGKSTLLNRLTGAAALAEDRLFATLDPTTRQLVLPGNQRVLLTDTVGFIQKLPLDLVSAFRATLEEVTAADVLLHVVDAAHPRCLEQAMVVYRELEALGALDLPMVTALNKIDLRAEPLPDSDLAAFPNPVPISAATGAGLEELRATLAAVVAGAYQDLTVHIPYHKGDLAHLFRERGRIEAEAWDAAGSTLAGRIPSSLAGLFRPFEVVQPAS